MWVPFEQFPALGSMQGRSGAKLGGNTCIQSGTPPRLKAPCGDDPPMGGGGVD